MEDKNLWTTFEKTGSVVDYLNYKGIHTNYTGSSEDFRKDYVGIGESTVESVGNSDRDDTVRNTYR